MFQKAMLMAMVHRSRDMQQDTLCARVKGLREGGSQMDTQMCSSLKPVKVLVWNIFLKKYGTRKVNWLFQKLKLFS